MVIKVRFRVQKSATSALYKMFIHAPLAIFAVE